MIGTTTFTRDLDRPEPSSGSPSGVIFSFFFHKDNQTGQMGFSLPIFKQKALLSLSNPFLFPYQECIFPNIIL